MHQGVQIKVWQEQGDNTGWQDLCQLTFYLQVILITDSMCESLTSAAFVTMLVFADANVYCEFSHSSLSIVTAGDKTTFQLMQTKVVLSIEGIAYLCLL